ncbi:MAG: tetratricopeptide repeat protein [Eubacteriales bacterium]|nr:tetratricopeptide repeat protein [Eubacteriales bacterium]
MDKNKKERITKYLTPKLDRFLFGELPEAFLQETGTESFMAGVPFPVEKTHLTDDSLSAVSIARNMAFVLGADPDFRYGEQYLRFIRTLFTEDFKRPLIKEAAESAKKEDFETACIFCRATLLFDPENRDALLLYGQALHDAYEAKAEEENPSLSDEEYIGNFKAESMEVFERITVLYPEEPAPYYYLGYAYLNLGLYNKSRLTFLEFTRLSKSEDEKKEAQDLIRQLKDPCILEEGVNRILSGHPETGIDILSEYENHPEYGKWWPLWYYLGIAHRDIGNTEEAVKDFLAALRTSPSNIDVMNELISLYESLGNSEKAEKYRKKIGVVKKNQEMDREQRRKESGMTVS